MAITCGVLLVLLAASVVLNCWLGCRLDETKESLGFADERISTLEAYGKRGYEIYEEYEEMQERIDGFDYLKYGWDSYDAEPISQQARNIAYAMSSVPSVVPTPDGGVQFEWHRMGWDVEIEIQPDGKIVGDASLSEDPVIQYGKIPEDLQREVDEILDRKRGIE